MLAGLRKWLGQGHVHILGLSVLRVSTRVLRVEIGRNTTIKKCFSLFVKNNLAPVHIHRGVDEVNSVHIKLLPWFYLGPKLGEDDWVKYCNQQMCL